MPHNHFVIFDLEATCWDNDKSQVSEIIEIGAVKLDDALNQASEFARFVRPTVNPILSYFCKQLTSINQKDVEQAKVFQHVIKEFENWIESDGDSVVLCSWGFYDKKHLLAECSLKDYSGRILNLLEKHISLKHQFAEIKGIKPCGMSKALRILRMPLDGTHHRAIDDARNIAKIFRVVFPDLEIPIR